MYKDYKKQTNNGKLPQDIHRQANLFTKTEIHDMLSTPKAKELYPTLFARRGNTDLKMMAATFVSKWRKGKYEILKMEEDAVPDAMPHRKPNPVGKLHLCCVLNSKILPILKFPKLLLKLS